jgi:hypothetical protein
MEDDRGQEHHGRVEIQQRGDDRLDPEQDCEERDRPASESLDPHSHRPEESVRLDHCSDQEQTGDEDKGGPRLAGGVEDRVGHRSGITANLKSQPSGNARPSRS